MRSKNSLLNLLGQIRVYSLIDLILLIIAIKADNFQLIGVIFLHIGFLLFLEYTHKHKYRMPFPKYLWAFLFLSGIVFYKSFFVIGFLICSFFYAKKNLPNFSPYSPFLRGLQSYFLTSGIIGFLNPISFLAGGLLALRNFAGDLRDITKDKKEKMKTLPIILGFNKDMKHIHLVFLLLTTFTWWNISDLSIIWLIVIYLIQIMFYNLTPR
ncbi:MAG: hypothetical protein KAR87_03985 [Candidatus Aenigmarchaeota archaeon]|nr:hypothetical protein [Candidatus Aenigmarchaeota archaeon]